MTKTDLIREIVATYEKHGWQLKRVLLRTETKAEIANNVESTIVDREIEDSSFDALWFTRPSHGAADAWELRLVVEAPYALFERIGRNETEENRAAILSEMEKRLEQYAKGSE